MTPLPPPSLDARAARQLDVPDAYVHGPVGDGRLLIIWPPRDSPNVEDEFWADLCHRQYLIEVTLQDGECFDFMPDYNGLYYIDDDDGRPAIWGHAWLTDRGTSCGRATLHVDDVVIVRIH